jgi:hypothetical protein
MKFLIMHFSPTSYYFIPLRSEYSPQYPVLKYFPFLLVIKLNYSGYNGLIVFMGRKIPVEFNIIFGGTPHLVEFTQEILVLKLLLSSILINLIFYFCFHWFECLLRIPTSSL